MTDITDYRRSYCSYYHKLQRNRTFGAISRMIRSFVGGSSSSGRRIWTDYSNKSNIINIGRSAVCRAINGTARSSSSSNDTTADFGFKEVKSSQKQEMVKEVFSKVAQKYDIMNDLMSAGAHRLWKDDFVSMMGLGAAARIQSDKVPRFLDVAGGTGDIAFRIVENLFAVYGHATVLKAGPSGAGVDDANKQVVVCDINPDMLAVGRQRAPIQLQSNKSDVVGFVEGNAELLPFPDESFDVYTIAFGLRNVTNKELALKEAYRVLRKGGRIMILEFSHVRNPVLSQIYEQYSFNVIPKIGGLVAGDSASYQYLVESIRRFPTQDDLLLMVKDAGFECTSYVNFSFGVVAAHSGFKR